VNRDIANEIVRILVSVFGGKNPERPLTIAEAAPGLTACYVNAVDLLQDAKLLADADRVPRAIALTVLALEELGKIPDLIDTAVLASISSDASGWSSFWRRYRDHNSKQTRIANYRRTIGTEIGSQTMFVNPGPYASFLPPDLGRSLDLLKLRSLYVDFWENRFVLPGTVAVDHGSILNYLFGVAQERADSFAHYHASEERSRLFLELRVRLASSDAQGEEDEFAWPPASVRDRGATDPHELRIDLHSLISHRTSSLALPDYASISIRLDDLLHEVPQGVTKQAMDHEVAVLAPRMESIKRLPEVGVRAVQMFKLIMHQARGRGIPLDEGNFPRPEFVT
jgi:AbiV family abortive infection protein